LPPFFSLYRALVHTLCHFTVYWPLKRTVVELATHAGKESVGGGYWIIFKDIDTDDHSFGEKSRS